jgi:hypothetical protein
VGELAPLEPAEIGGIYGRSGSITTALFGHCGSLSKPKPRIITTSLLILIAVLSAAGVSGTLLGDSGTAWAFGVPGNLPASTRLPLLLDPVGMIVLITSILTPIFCIEQITEIQRFVEDNETNIAYRAPSLDSMAINRLIGHINKCFTIVGYRSVSIAIGVGSTLASYLMYVAIRTHGLLASWNSSSWHAHHWRKLVYDGWWANSSTHPVFAGLLVATGAFMIYHLTKQVTMGILFAVFARRALTLGFSSFPNLTRNTDGYNGQRSLRYFMQWTYVATLLDFGMMIGILLVWLPFSALTVSMLSLVVASNIFTVLYPTTVAVSGAITEKRMYVEALLASAMSPPAGTSVEAAVGKVWDTTNLPFRLRGTLSVVTLYLLIPVILAIISAVLN